MVQRRVGRPSKGGPVIAVSADGRGVAWCDGVFQGDRDLVRAANDAARWGWLIRLHPMGMPVMASFDSLDGATAAMFGTAPGRAVLVDAPSEVWNLFPQESPLDVVDSGHAGDF